MIFRIPNTDSYDLAILFQDGGLLHRPIYGAAIRIHILHI